MKKFLLLFSLFLIFSCSKDESLDEDTPIVFDLSTSVSPSIGGSITGVGGAYKNGGEVTLTATPSENFEFIEWQGDFTGSENPLKFVMSSDTEVVAIFEEKVYSLDFDIVGKWYIQNSTTHNSSATNKQSDDSSCSVYSIEFREDGTYILITAEGEVSGQFVIIGNKSIDLGIGQIEDLSFINDVLSFTITLESGCSSDLSALLLTYVPDDAFENELIRLGYDNTLDNFVETVNIREVKTLHLEPSPQIIDFTGLEDFDGLEVFKVWSWNHNPNIETPPVFEIDFTSNVNLKYLQLDGVGITDLNLENNSLIETVYLSLTSLSGTVSFPNNPLLREVAVSENYQQPRVNINIDFTHNPNLESFSGDVTWIEKLDISNNPKLKMLSVTEFVKEIITSGLYENLRILELTGTQYNRHIDFAKFPNLEKLIFDTNLESLDVSTNTKLNELTLHGALNIKFLDLSHNSSLSDFHIDTDRAPNLMCIKVSEEQLSKLGTEDFNWTSGVNYSVECE